MVKFSRLSHRTFPLIIIVQRHFGDSGSGPIQIRWEWIMIIRFYHAFIFIDSLRYLLVWKKNHASKGLICLPNFFPIRYPIHFSFQCSSIIISFNNFTACSCSLSFLISVSISIWREFLFVNEEQFKCWCSGLDIGNRKRKSRSKTSVDFDSRRIGWNERNSKKDERKGKGRRIVEGQRARQETGSSDEMNDCWLREKARFVTSTSTSDFSNLPLDMQNAALTHNE